MKFLNLNFIFMLVMALTSESSAAKACGDCLEDNSSTTEGALRARRTRPMTPIDYPEYTPAPTDPTLQVITFEGICDSCSVGDYYNGLGGMSKNFGVSFSGSAFVLVDSHAGGNGHFENMPSPSTAMFGNYYEPVVMNVPAGFVTELSFYFSNLGDDGSYTVYSGLNGSGTVLALGTLPALGLSPEIYPAYYAEWVQINAAFSGTAHSVIFRGKWAFYDKIEVYIKP